MHFVLVVEEISRVDPSVGLTLAAHSGLRLQHIALFASGDQKKRYIPDVATGAKIGSWCLTEPGSGSDASGMKRVSRRKKIYRDVKILTIGAGTSEVQNMVIAKNLLQT